jgi:7-cyano-7-deazaguanine synthase
MKKAVVLLSGGVDSTVTLAVAKSENFDIHAVSFDYGQRHGIELTFAEKSAADFTVRKHLVIRFNLRNIGGSALTSDIEVPKDRNVLSVTSDGSKNRLPVTHHASPESEIPVTYVPARNTIFLSFALSLAESIGAEDIFIGANAVDYSGYPDCRPEFIRAFESMANLATKASVEGTSRFRIQAPLIDLTKGSIIRKGLELGVDFSKTWSCYDPQKSGNELSVMSNGLRKETHNASRVTLHGFVPCTRCDSCILRAKGFRQARVEDPWDLK